ncbi:hypothetical protein DPMN_097016 [Dreissena polymorpha]|uniref:Uncharacterized protein n=1 Tax=Dreissena polymorpha TaxID=45954 RepID=A0A9D4R4C1_DREPO|nr:hypothetical protein DPMN_097016 [Dreissena polymorpha]
MNSSMYGSTRSILAPSTAANGNFFEQSSRPKLCKGLRNNDRKPVAETLAKIRENDANIPISAMMNITRQLNNQFYDLYYVL